MITLPAGPAVFAVEDTSAQFTWRTLPAGDITIRCGPQSAAVVTDGGPGVVSIDGLTADTAYDARFERAGATIATVAFRTVATPPGEELFRFATMSDLHLGRLRFGVRHTLADPAGVVPHPVRCSDAARAELLAWGAQHLVVKGDFVDSSTGHSWDLAADFLRGVPVDHHVLPGNHEMAHGDHQPFENATSRGIDLVRDVTTFDAPGLRMVLMNSAIIGVDIGRWHHLSDRAADAAAEAAGAAMVLVHHHPHPTPIPMSLPVGINSISATRFAKALAAANPATMGSSGHTHRHRRRVIAGVPWTEVGSPKDYPGTWAGYVVHEGGIRQVVRRVAAPDCLEWLDSTRYAAGGLWGLYSPGRLRDRCFTHVWPARSGR